MPSQRPLPIVWTEEQLEEDRKTSRERFVNSILSRGTGEYVAIYTEPSEECVRSSKKQTI